jgi:adenosylcobinamide-GDP ribazoletransferase
MWQRSLSLESVAVIEPGTCPRWAPPLVALQFLTRVPMPALDRLPREIVSIALGRAVGWFPLVGALVGAVTAGTFIVTDQIWPRIVAVLVALIVEARLTGAFHEDAVADFCDGFGGGRDPAHVRQIMKDSRIGSYGALGLALALALRAALMWSLPESPLVVFVAIVAAASFGRLTAVVAMRAIPSGLPDNRDPNLQRSLVKDVGSTVPPSALLLAAITATPALLPFALIKPFAFFFAVAAAGLFLIWFRTLLLRKLGGITGDCLGFAVYVAQILVLLAATAS